MYFFILVLRMPFNTKSPIGYVVPFAFQSIGIYLIFYLVSLGFGMMVGGFFLVTCVGEEVQLKICDLNENYKFNNIETSIEEELYHIVEQHKDVQQFSIFIIKIIYKQMK